MMTNRGVVSWLVVALAVCLIPAVASAQWTDAAGGSGEPVTNPDSTIPLLPFVVYDPATGVLSIINNGENGLVDSMDNSTIGGDDVGMISLVVPLPNEVAGNAAEQIIGIPGDPIPFFADGILWNSFLYFAGKVQLAGQSAGAEFLPISDAVLPDGRGTAVWRTQPGLGWEDFGSNDVDRSVEVEMGVNFRGVPPTPGNTMFGPLTIIPEPSCLCLVGSALLGLIGIARRRS